MFHIDELKLYLHCALEDGQSWDQPLSLDSFLLEGVASGPLPVSTEISLAKIGLKLIGHTVTSFGNLRQDTKEYTEFSYRFFGTVVIDKPNWGSEVVLDFELTKLNACTYLSARATCEWRDLFDIKGLTVSDVIASLLACFSLSKEYFSCADLPWESRSHQELFSQTLSSSQMHSSNWVMAHFSI